MEESIFGYFLMLCGMGYGFYRFILAVIREDEAKRRAGELAWQREGL